MKKNVDPESDNKPITGELGSEVEKTENLQKE